MKFSRLSVLFGLCSAAILGASGTAFAGDADFYLTNRTGYAIRELYISPSHKGQWGNDMLGGGVLNNGGGGKVSFSGSSDACEQDIMVVFDDDESKVTWEDVNLCEINKITLKYNRSSGEVSAIAE